MQFSAVLNIFIVKTKLNSTFTNDLKRKYFFRKMSIVTEVAALRRVVVSYKRKYVHKVLVNCLFKLAQEKVWLGE